MRSTNLNILFTLFHSFALTFVLLFDSIKLFFEETFLAIYCPFSTLSFYLRLYVNISLACLVSSLFISNLCVSKGKAFRDTNQHVYQPIVRRVLIRCSEDIYD